MFSPSLFAGKTIAITGAGRGIGLAVAVDLLGCGARLVIHVGRSRPEALPRSVSDAEAAGRAILVTGDFSDAADVAAFAGQVLSVAPSLDGLVNNAGTMVGRFSADSMTDAQYEAIVRLNQDSVVTLTRALIPALRAAGSSAIVNTVSISARTGGSPGSAVYSAAKAFVATYSKALARELAPAGIRVNCVSPGTITTDFHARYSSPEKLEATRRTIPLGRLGEAGDCAPSYLFLLAPDLSGYITGQTIEINGGQLIC